MSDHIRWKLKANIWKRAYDEEHASLADAQLRFEVEKKRADALEIALTTAQKFSELSARATEQRAHEYDELISVLREKLKEFPENMPFPPGNRGGFASPSRRNQLTRWLETVWVRLSGK